MTISYTDGTLSLLKRWRGSVYKKVILQLGVYLVLWYIIRVVYHRALNENQQETFENTVKTLNKHMDSSFHLTFILGFYVSTIVKRWWSQLNLLVWPDSLVSYSTFIFSNTCKIEQKKAKMRRHQITRYLMLSCVLVLRDLSSKVLKRFPTVGHVVQSGLMTPNESIMFNDCPSDTGRWMLPLEWINKIIRESMDNNNTPPPICASFIGELNKYRQKLIDLYMYDWVNIPLVYTQVAAIATYSYFLLTLIVRQYLDHNKKIQGYEIDLYFPIFTCLEFIFYVGWFEVGQELMKPWGEDDDDAELNFIIDRHLRVAFSISDIMGNQECPPIIEDRFWFEHDAVHIPSLPHTPQSGKIREHAPKKYVLPKKYLDPVNLMKTFPQRKVNSADQKTGIELDGGVTPSIVEQYNSTPRLNF